MAANPGLIQVHEPLEDSMNMQKRTWEILEVAEEGDRVSRWFDIFILALIFLSVAAVIGGSVPSVAERYGGALYWFEVFSVAVFTVEYIGRIWACVTSPSFRRPVADRIRFALTPLALIDLLAILPFYLPFVGVDLRSLRALRLLRVLRVAKVGRYYSALRLIRGVMTEQKEELAMTTGIMLLLLIMSASMIYYAENPAQPEQFSSIPASMWWTVVTLTTLGYGDVYPVTIAGKVLAGITAVLGIGMFALPTGIIGSGFVEQIQKSKAKPTCCPHCGGELTSS